MAGHTQEPWEREQAQDGEYTGPGDNPPGYAGDFYETNNVGHLDRETGEWTPTADCYHPADAARVVACVNCCEGVPTEALAAGLVRAMLDGREELLEACERALLLRACDSVTRDLLRAVIRKHRGA